MTPAEKAAVFTAADLALEAARAAEKTAREAGTVKTTQAHETALAAAEEARLAAEAAEAAAMALDADEADENPDVWEAHLSGVNAADQARRASALAQEVGENPPAASEAAEAIAHRVLRIPTLETRCSDTLDFHDLPVWALKAALEAAFAAGCAHTDA